MNDKSTKKVFVMTALLLLVSLALVSCSAIPGYSEPEEQSVVSAIGFDFDGSLLTVTLRLEDGDERTLSATGDTIESAIASITAREPRSLEVSHLALIVLGEGIDRELFESILDFCRRNEEISISAMLVSAENAGSLLASDLAAGYGLLSAVSGERQSSSIGNEARLYRVYGALLSDGVFFLPYFIMDEAGFELFGGRIYRHGDPLTLLDRNESAYYLMICGLFDRGILGGDAPGLSFGVGISDCKTTYSFSSDGESTTLTVKVAATLDSEISDEDHAAAITSAAEENMARLYASLNALHGDVFGFWRIAERKGVANDGIKVKFECTKRG